MTKILKNLLHESKKCLNNCRSWTVDVESIESAIKEKEALLEHANSEVATATTLNEKLLALVEEEKSLLTQQKSESEKSLLQVMEENEGKLKAAEKDFAEITEKKKHSSLKYKDAYNQMNQKLQDRNTVLSTSKQELSALLERYSNVQENIEHLHDLLAKNMEKDNKQIVKQMLQQTRKKDVDDSLLPPSFLTLEESARLSQSSAIKTSASSDAPVKSRGQKDVSKKTEIKPDEEKKVLTEVTNLSSQDSKVSSSCPSDDQRLSQPLTQVISQPIDNVRDIEVLDIDTDSAVSEEMF